MPKTKSTTTFEQLSHALDRYERHAADYGEAFAVGEDKGRGDLRRMRAARKRVNVLMAKLGIGAVHDRRQTAVVK